ncbi:MAG: 2-C-methyl-D-erythritol 4-phosphate cytidylyltransferase [Paludibacter sp.]|nr:2-C-methyl-D-erythritol 4-phosphate cytidylyltransferase [Paludibacter sp.]
MTKSVIIVAGGKGTRMCVEIPKQFIEIGGKPILMHTISTFYNYDKTIKIVLVLPENQIVFWKNLCEKHNFLISHTIVGGGAERFYSVKNGLQYADTELVAVHDGVRPMVSTQTIDECFSAAERFGAAIPVMQIAESLRFVKGNENHAVERKNYVRVQTPQIFQQKIIQRAYNQPFEQRFTDDASVVENIGQAIFLTCGNTENIKITKPADFKIAEILIKDFIC